MKITAPINANAMAMLEKNFMTVPSTFLDRRDTPISTL
jgi:hypothetical protein